MKTFLLLLCLLIGYSASAQFFGSQRKPQRPDNEHNELLKINGGLPDTSVSVLRPLVSVAAFTIPGNILMSGTGISFQRLHFDWVTSKWYCKYSISAMVWAGSSLGDSTMKSQTSTISYGIMLGIKNNLILVGPAINNGKLVFTFSVGISLNN